MPLLTSSGLTFHLAAVMHRRTPGLCDVTGGCGYRCHRAHFWPHPHNYVNTWITRAMSQILFEKASDSNQQCLHHCNLPACPLRLPLLLCYEEHDSSLKVTDFYVHYPHRMDMSVNLSQLKLEGDMTRRSLCVCVYVCVCCSSHQGCSQWAGSRWTVGPWRWWGQDSSCPSGCPDRSHPDCWCCSDRSSYEKLPAHTHTNTTSLEM